MKQIIALALRKSMSTTPDYFPSAAPRPAQRNQLDRPAQALRLAPRTETTFEPRNGRGQVRGWLPALAILALVTGSTVSALATDHRAPQVPGDIAVQPGNKVHFHGFGRGVQIYTWDGSSWGKPVPEATLFDDEGNVVAIHFAGPTWESNSGSRVVGAVVPPQVIVDPDAIPWLLLKAVSAEGPGIFADTTFIQRVNTSGGKAPETNGTAVGQVARVPYTADYFFYRHANN
jgi:hypothetical protein